MAITLIHCPNCKFAMSADDSSASPLTCPHCGRKFIYADTITQKPQASANTNSPNIEQYLQQAESAMLSKEYLLCLDAANAALNIDKGNPDALFFQQAANAFSDSGIDANRMRNALDRAEAAMEANEFYDTQKAAHFKNYLLFVRQFLIVKSEAARERLKNDYCTEEDIADMRADLAILLELCINSIGYLPTSLLQVYPEAEESVRMMLDEGVSLCSLLKDHYKYYDFPSAAYLVSYAPSSIKSASAEALAQLTALKENLPSIVAKKEEIRRKQDASKLSIQSFWEEHNQEYLFLQKYLYQTHIKRITYTIGSIVLFLALIVGLGFGLKALLNAGIGQGLYYLCIFGLMVIMIAYWISYSIIQKKLDFKKNATMAKRYLASPLGKEDAIQNFITQKQQKHSLLQSSLELRHRLTKKLLLTSGLIAAVFLGLCLALIYFIIPAVNLSKAKNAVKEGDSLSAIIYFERAGNYSNAKELLSEQLAVYRQRAISYDGRIGAYNNMLAVRDATGDIYYTEFSSTAYPSVAITNAQSFVLTQNYIVAVRSDGYVSYSQYTTAADATAPDVSSWSEIVALSKINNVIVGYQQDGTLVYNTSELDSETLARLHGDQIAGIYDKFGDIAVRTDGTASLPSADRYSYADKVQEVFEEIEKWKNLAVIKGDITNHIVGLTKDGRVYAVSGWFDSSYGELNVSSWRNIVDIACGESHTVGLLADGTVVATGSNSYGQCDVSEWKDIVAIEAGNNFTMGVASDGTIYITGHESSTYIPRGMNQICVLADESHSEEGESQTEAEDNTPQSSVFL